jgi:hypothetical protein
MSHSGAYFDANSQGTAGTSEKKRDQIPETGDLIIMFSDPFS